jgi:hypothetical protein
VDITGNLPAIVLIVAGIGLVGMLILQTLQIGHLRERIEMLTRGVDGENLEGVLDAHLDLVHQLGAEMDELAARTSGLEDASRRHFARLGLVRFNPFPDTGGNQSFALALLDESDDGVVVSSLHSRTGTRVYAKAVAAGKADTSLSAEEEEAMEIARSRKVAKPVPAKAAPAKAVTAPVPVPPAKAAPAPEPAIEVTTVDEKPRWVAEPGPTRFRGSPSKPASAPAPLKATAAPIAPAAVKTTPVAAPSGELVDRKSVVKGQSKLELPPADEDSSSERTGRRSRPIQGSGSK